MYYTVKPVAVSIACLDGTSRRANMPSLPIRLGDLEEFTAEFETLLPRWVVEKSIFFYNSCDEVTTIIAVD